MADASALAYLQSRLDLFLHDLAALSSMDCGTYDKAGVDAVGHVLREKLERMGLAVEVCDGGALGDSLVARWRGRGGARYRLRRARHCHGRWLRRQYNRGHRRAHAGRPRARRRPRP